MVKEIQKLPTEATALRQAVALESISRTLDPDGEKGSGVRDVSVDGISVVDEDGRANIEINERFKEVIKSIDILTAVSKGQIWDSEQVECEGHSQLPTGGEFGNIDEAYGKTEQESTEGRQLLDWGNWRPSVLKGTGVFENNGITLTAIENDCYTNYNTTALKIPVTPGEVITLSWDADSNSPGFVYIFPNADTAGMVNANNDVSKKVSYRVGDGVSFITFRFGVLQAGTTIKYSNIMIEKGLIAHPWEPYTGGIPSPNPDYPQEIKSVEEIHIRKTGRNFVPNNWIQGMRNLTNGKTVIQNDYWVSLNDRIHCPFQEYKLSATIANKVCVLYYDKDGNYLGYQQPMKYSNKVGVEKLSGAEYLSITFNVDGAAIPITPANMEEYELQLLLGDSFDPYEPYYEETRTITPPRPLNAIGEDRDICDVVEGVWKYQTAELVDTKALSLQSVNSYGIANFSIPDIADGKANEVIGKGGIAFVCDYFSLSADLIAQTTLPGMLRNSSGKSYVRFYASEVPTLQKANEWLEEHRPKTVYVLAQPVTEPISPSDLSYLRDLTLLPEENLFITDNHGRDVSYLMSNIIKLNNGGGDFSIDENDLDNMLKEVFG